MERYDPTIDQWSILGTMAVGREGAGLVVATDHIYCMGGYDGINLLNSVEKYDPNTCQWTSVAPMATRRSGQSLLLTIGNILISSIGTISCQI